MGQENFAKNILSALKINKVSNLPSSEEIKDNVKLIRDVFVTGLRKIFVLANQLPLLDLFDYHYSGDYGIEDEYDLGKGFEKFLDIRSEQLNSLGKNLLNPLDIIAFLDPNNLLSYDLKCWYYRHAIGKRTSFYV